MDGKFQSEFDLFFFFVFSFRKKQKQPATTQTTTTKTYTPNVISFRNKHSTGLLWTIYFRHDFWVEAVYLALKWWRVHVDVCSSEGSCKRNSTVNVMNTNTNSEKKEGNEEKLWKLTPDTLCFVLWSCVGLRLTHTPPDSFNAPDSWAKAAGSIFRKVEVSTKTNQCEHHHGFDEGRKSPFSPQPHYEGGIPNHDLANVFVLLCVDDTGDTFAIDNVLFWAAFPSPLPQFFP